MNKVIVIGSFVAVTLLVLASFSPVADCQTINSESENANQLFKDKKQKFSDPIKENEVNRKLIVQKLTDMLNKTGHNVRTRFQSLFSNHSFVNNRIANKNISLGLVSTLILTILSEFYVYVTFFSESHNISLGTIAKLFLVSVVINTITNPAMNLIYLFIYDNITVLEHIVFIIETFMILVSFNLLSLKINFEESAQLSLLANIFSYSFCRFINQLIDSILDEFVGNGLPSTYVNVKM